MSQETTTAESIEAVAAELDLAMTAVFVPWSKSRNAGEKHPSLNWKIRIDHTTPEFQLPQDRGPRRVKTNIVPWIDYSAGSGHCPSYKQGRQSVVEAEVIRWECEHGKPGRFADGMGCVISRAGADPILPKFADVLYSLCSEADAIDYSDFEEWAASFGLDTDSRKAEATYRACLDTALKLRNGLGEAGFAKLREACQGY